MDPFSEKLDEDLDYALAVSLQSFENESIKLQEISTTANSFTDRGKENKSKNLNKPSSIVDVEWETLDPIPDIHSLFLQFNSNYFWNALAGVEVRWSRRMTLCAGLCCYEGQGGLCSIRLSQPLLKFRPRRDLVETLLHEMIHAYLFVTHNNKDHNAHGPEFLKHMNRINTETGTKITVYHSFHDEVDIHRTHWWKCNGPCQNSRPFYGLVKRAMNRAPSAQDPWWKDHQVKCGGTFIKIKEPENYQNKKQAKRKIDSSHEIKDIRNFLSPNSSSQSEEKNKSVINKSSNVHTLSSSECGHETKDIRNFLSPNSSSQSEEKNKSVINKSSNVHTLSSSECGKKIFVPFSGQGHVLNAESSKSKRPSSSSLPLRKVPNATNSKTSNIEKIKRPNLVLPHNGSENFTKNGVKEHWTLFGSLKESPKSSQLKKQSSINFFFKDQSSSSEIECDNLDDSIECLSETITVDKTIKVEKATKVACPACGTDIENSLINDHLDDCLKLF